MRMWMVNPRNMCRQHLMGEHVELHMFLGAMRKGISMQGYLDNNMLEPESIVTRHTALVQEMQRRGYKHNSPLTEAMLDEACVGFRARGLRAWDTKIDRDAAEAELLYRCKECCDLAAQEVRT